MKLPATNGNGRISVNPRLNLTPNRLTPQRLVLPVRDGENGPTLDASVVKATASLPNATDFTETWLANRFRELNGSNDEMLRAELTSEHRQQQELRDDWDRLRKPLQEVPEHIEDTSASASIRTRLGHQVGVTVLWVIFVGMSLIAWFNAARFALDLTQDWPRAFLYTSALPCVPLALKFFVDATNGNSRKYAMRWLAAVGAIAAIVFMVTYARHFALEASIEELQGTNGADLRLQLISQLVLEVVIGSALFLWIQKLTSTAIVMIPNPRWATLQERRANLSERIRVSEKRVAELQAELKSFTAGLEVFVGKGMALLWDYQQLQKEMHTRVRQLSEHVGH